MYLVKTPKWLQSLMPAYLWRLSGPGKVLYLTFDDGPIPEVTPWVLEQLRKYQARATFFCVGENVSRHETVYRQILTEGHAVGNHTYNHLNGWHTPPPKYLNNVRRCARLVDSPLFRPPYGRLTPRQRGALEAHFQIVLWDVLSGDFDPHISPAQCLENVVQAAEPGSIVVFHDSLKSNATLRAVLPEVLRIFSEKGYRFEALPMRRQAARKRQVALRAV